MDFGWGDEQTVLYDQALSFARSVDGSDGFSREAWRACAGFGLTGLTVPEALGGLGVGALTAARIVEAFGRGLEDGGLLFSASAHLFACVMPLVDHGDPGLQEEFVPRLATGEWIGANAMTEPAAGSDISTLATTARKDGDDYVLDGVKSYVTNGPVADLFLVYATTNAKAGYLGHSVFCVPRDTPGLSVGQPIAKTGLNSSPLSSVYLESCRVPARWRVGREGQGRRIFAHSMHWERACLTAGFVGYMERELDACVEFAKSRVQHGKPISKHQAVSHRIAEMKLRLEGARLLLYRACWERDQGQDATLAVSLAKLAVSEAGVANGLDAIRVHGGLGYMAESGVDQGLRNALGATIFSGTSDIQRELVCHRLGL